MLSAILLSVEMESKDKNKFETLYYKYRQRLYNCALKAVGNRADAEDVLQNAFIKIARNIKSVAEVDSKETIAFLTVITKNAAYDFLRKKSSLSEAPLEHAEEISDFSYSVENAVSRLEYQTIVAVIKNIPSPYNEVLFLHFVKDFSIKKTARLLERKPDTVKMQLVRGKKILAEKLSEALYD